METQITPDLIFQGIQAFGVTGVLVVFIYGFYTGNIRSGKQVDKEFELHRKINLDAAKAMGKEIADGLPEMIRGVVREVLIEVIDPMKEDIQELKNFKEKGRL